MNEKTNTNQLKQLIIVPYWCAVSDCWETIAKTRHLEWWWQECYQRFLEPKLTKNKYENLEKDREQEMCIKEQEFQMKLTYLSHHAKRNSGDKIISKDIVLLCVGFQIN